MGRLSQWIALGVCHKHGWKRSFQKRLPFLFRWSACDCHCNTKTNKLAWSVCLSWSWINLTLFKYPLLVSGHVLLSALSDAHFWIYRHRNDYYVDSVQQKNQSCVQHDISLNQNKHRRFGFGGGGYYSHNAVFVRVEMYAFEVLRQTVSILYLAVF